MVSKWLNDLSQVDANVVQMLKKIMLCSVESLSVDVVKLFRPPSELFLIVLTIQYNT